MKLLTQKQNILATMQQTNNNHHNNHPGKAEFTPKLHSPRPRKHGARFEKEKRGLTILLKSIVEKRRCGVKHSLIQAPESYGGGRGKEERMEARGEAEGSVNSTCAPVVSLRSGAQKRLEKPTAVMKSRVQRYSPRSLRAGEPRHNSRKSSSLITHAKCNSPSH